MRKPLKAYVNVLKLRLAWRLARIDVSHQPIAAYIDPTLFCNLQCPACPTGLGLDLRPRVTLARERFEASIDELGDCLFHVYLYNWGEPLLHKETPELIAYAKRRGIRVSLSTNLSMPLSDDYVRRLVESGLDVMVASIDGTSDATYTRYRRGGSLDLVKRNLLGIREARERAGLRTPRITWQFLVFRHNEHELDDVRANYKTWGADDIAIDGAQMPAPPHDDGFAPSTIAAYDFGHPDHHLRRKARDARGRGRACSWLYGITVINPNGTVSPCCAVPAEADDFGTWHTGQAWASVWNGDAYRAARRLFRQDAGPRETAERRAIICDRCPIPFRQDDVDGVLADVSRTLGGRVGHGSVADRAYSLIAWIVMGAPRPRSFVGGLIGRS